MADEIQKIPMPVPVQRTWVPGSKSYAAGIGAGLADPIQSFVTNFCLWLGGDESWARPLGIIIAIMAGFGLTYIAPSQHPDVAPPK